MDDTGHSGGKAQVQRGRASSGRVKQERRRIIMAETEEQLIQAARDAVSQCNWVVGECASKWVQRYSRGRTDADFGQMVGLSGDQIYQRRRVWDRFGGVYAGYETLKWSFFYIALNWDDAEECFAWAQESAATVAEMRAWRRAQNGEDLLTETGEELSEWAAPPLMVNTSDLPLSAVMDPAGFIPSGEGDRAGLPGSGQAGAGTMGMVARDSGDASYAPFRQGAASVPGETADHDTTHRKEPMSPEQFWKRAAGALHRINNGLSDVYLEALAEQPESVREKLLTAVNELSERLQKELV